jgi:serine protease inhibitor
VSNKQIIAANTRFAFKLFAALVQQDSGANIFISPASIALALAMTYNGARGETAQAMAYTLEFGELSLDAINQANAELKALLVQQQPHVALAIANSLWARQGVEFSSEFMQRNTEFYAAEIVELDFAASSAVARINDWVRQQTNDKIAKIIDDIPGAAILFLINAIYFKGDWTKTFDKAQTRPGSFTLRDGTQQQHPMMTQSGDYRYFENADVQAISLPYADGRLSMYIFLPAPQSSLAAFQATLNAANWDGWMRQFHSKEGRIVLPRFRLEYEVTLNQALSALGMAIAFAPQSADFSGMVATAATGPRLCIDEVKHKTFVDVNEEGTEAAAITAVIMTRASFTAKRKFSMVVDRPFFCAIRDDQSGTILFMGSVSEPKSA